jgi:hypothetical protein
VLSVARFLNKKIFFDTFLVIFSIICDETKQKKNFLNKILGESNTKEKSADR